MVLRPVIASPVTYCIVSPAPLPALVSGGQYTACDSRSSLSSPYHRVSPWRWPPPKSPQLFSWTLLSPRLSPLHLLVDSVISGAMTPRAVIAPGNSFVPKSRAGLLLLILLVLGPQFILSKSPDTLKSLSHPLGSNSSVLGLTREAPR